ncbi:MAG: hypothetical protein HC905_08370 [Bacteroidales bacterium]|nr:hypothetical protein [Bacteroidales bacterium]
MVSAEINLPDLSVFKSESQKEASFLMKVLGEVRKLNPSFLKYRNGYEVKTLLNYPQKWGLGSSSTFISNLAQWAKVDAMLLNKAISEGSGYDIACATAKSPILSRSGTSSPTGTKLAFIHLLATVCILYTLTKSRIPQKVSEILNRTLNTITGI